MTSIGCAFALEAGHLIGLRLLQGLAACGGVVLARSLVRDLAEKDAAARAMSLMHACSSLAPMLAPLIGIMFQADEPVLAEPPAVFKRMLEAAKVVEQDRGLRSAAQQRRCLRIQAGQHA